MITIFEGPDGGGKTTLMDEWVKWIAWRRPEAEVLRVNHGPHQGLDGDALAELYVADLRRSPETCVLVDRSWLSEVVYGPVARDACRIDASHAEFLAGLARDVGAIVIWCLPPYEACRRAYLSRRALEYLEDEAQLRRVYDGFVTLAMLHWEFQSHSYNYQAEPSMRSFIEMVEEFRLWGRS